MTRQTIKNKKNALMQLSDELQDQFIAFIHDRVGILIKRGHKELHKVISEACEKYKYSPLEYLDQLKVADDNSELINQLVTAITIGETYFFRDKRQVKLLQDNVLPALIQIKRDRNEKVLRIWSAGCSSGEEIYTVVMLLNDLGINFDEWQCFFLATDINIDLLRKGINGKYSEWSMRSIPEIYLKKYFTKEGANYQLDDKIRRLVNFDYLNLNSDGYPSIMNGTSMQDLIICRNVLIYFDNHHIKKILERLTKSVVDDGYLLLGASDPIALMGPGIKSVPECPSLFVKGERKEIVHQGADVGWVEQSETQHFYEAAQTNVGLRSAQPNIHPQNDDEIKQLIAKEQWSDAIFKIDQQAMSAKLTSQQLVFKAMALANLGKTIEAIKISEEAIVLDKMNKEAYFIYALSLAELNKYKEAENAFRKALYIDPGFVICRYQFGLFLVHIKRQQEGIKALQSAIKTASQFSDDAVVPDTKNTRYKDLLSVLKNEIELYQ